MTTGESDYIVVRGTGEPSVDGKWFARRDIEVPFLFGDEGLTLFATGALEYREDGAFAEIYRPKGSYEIERPKR